MTTSVLVLGATGQLGLAIVRCYRSRANTAVIAPRVRWQSSALTLQDLGGAVDTWFDTSHAESFIVVWAAGAAITSTPSGTFSEEIDVFASFCGLLAEALSVRDLAGQAQLFFASSAGGIYAGADGAPHSELTTAAPITPYGETKLAMEEVVHDLVATSGIRAVVGRIANLYGPDQRIEKPQGFISQLCQAMIFRKPLSVYVSLDTVRDYIFTDDAATVIQATLDRLAPGVRSNRAVIKNIASHTPATLGQVLHEAELVFKRKPDFVLASSSHARGQVRDLRISSLVFTELNDIPRRPLLLGLAKTRASIESQFLAGGPRKI